MAQITVNCGEISVNSGELIVADNANVPNSENTNVVITLPQKGKYILFSAFAFPTSSAPYLNPATNQTISIPSGKGEIKNTINNQSVISEIETTESNVELTISHAKVGSMTSYITKLYYCVFKL